MDIVLTRIPSSLRTVITLSDMDDNMYYILQDPQTARLYLERSLGTESEFYTTQDADITLFNVLRWLGMSETANVGILKASDSSILSHHLMHIPLRYLAAHTFTVHVWDVKDPLEPMPLSPPASDLPCWPAMWDLLDTPSSDDKVMESWYDQMSYNSPSPALVM